MASLTNFDQLSYWVSVGEVEITTIVSVPRSCATALELALLQAPEAHGQINEPFYHPDLKFRPYESTAKVKRSFEEALGKIIKRTELLFRETYDRPMQLIVHEHAGNFSRDEFKTLQQLKPRLIFNVRDPAKQALSQLTRIVNDQISSPGGANLTSMACLEFSSDLVTGCTQSDVDAFLDRYPKVSKENLLGLAGKEEGDVTTEIFQAAREKVLADFLEAFATSWDNLAAIAKEASHEKYEVFDGETLFDPSHAPLKALVACMG